MIRQNLWERDLLITTLDTTLDYQRIPVSTASERDGAWSLSVKSNYIAVFELSVDVRLFRVFEMRLYAVGIHSGAVPKGQNILIQK